MIIDVKGMPCPKPLIEVKKAIDSLTETTDIEVLLDDETAICNVIDFLAQLGISANRDGSTVRFTTSSLESVEVDISCPVPSGNDHIIVIKSTIMGEGSDELGEILMKAYISTILELDTMPTHIIFYNGGVKLACGDSAVIEQLRMLEQRGVMMIVCGTCADYYSLKDRVSVGVISNMYKIAELLNRTNKVVYP